MIKWPWPIFKITLRQKTNNNVGGGGGGDYFHIIMIIIVFLKVFLKRKILSPETILSTRAHTCTQEFWLYKAKYMQLKLGSKRPGDLEWIDTWNRKHCRSTILGKDIFLDLIWMSTERASVREEGEGHSMLMDWKQKRRGNQQWRVLCEESGGWEYQKWSACKVEDSHRDKTVQCWWYIYSIECWSCTEFFVGLESRGEIETEVLCGQFYVISVINLNFFFL